MTFSAHDWAPLQPILHDILVKHQDGLSEFELFNILKSPPYELFNAEALRDPLPLFQSHFILFNALYQLRDTCLQNQTGLLEIHCTNICYAPWQAGTAGLTSEDKLRIYYLDWTNLSDTNQSQVEAMLDSFWSAFSGRPNQAQNSNMSMQQALDLLKLSSPYSAQQLKQQYRQMLHIHHPDKGGNHEQTILLHEAYERLLNE